MEEMEIVEYKNSETTELNALEFFIEVIKEETTLLDIINSSGYVIPFIYPIGKLREITGSNAVKIHGGAMYDAIINVEDKMIISTVAKCEDESKQCYIFVFRQLSGILRNGLVRGWVVYQDDDKELLKKVLCMWKNKVCESRPVFMREENV